MVFLGRDGCGKQGHLPAYGTTSALPNDPLIAALCLLTGLLPPQGCTTCSSCAAGILPSRLRPAGSGAASGCTREHPMDVEDSPPQAAHWEHLWCLGTGQMPPWECRPTCVGFSRQKGWCWRGSGPFQARPCRAMPPSRAVLPWGSWMPLSFPKQKILAAGMELMMQLK